MLTSILPHLNDWAITLAWILTTLQPFDYLQGDCPDHSQIQALTLKIQTCLSNGQRQHRDTKGIGCGNMPSILTIVEKTTDNNKQTNQVDSFGRRIKKVDL